MSRIRASVLTPDDIPAHVALAATTYPGEPPADPDHLRWKHLQNPAGPSIAITLDHPATQGAMGGHVFLQRRRWVRPDGTQCDAGLVTDLVLAPDARDARSFIALMRAARTPTGVDLVIHTANETSETLYRRLLRYPVACELQAYGAPTGHFRVAGDGRLGDRLKGLSVATAGVVMGRLARVAAPVLRRLAQVSLSTVPPSDAVADTTLAAFGRAAGAHLRRDRSFIAWRFGSRADHSEVYWVTLRDGTRGYMALSPVVVGGMSALAVQDVAIPRPPRPLEGVALRTTVLAIASRAHAGVALGLWNPAAPLSRWMTGLPFVTIPVDLLPHGSPIFLATASDAPDASAGGATAFLALADLDYF